MPTKRRRRVRGRTRLSDAMKWLLVHGPDVLYPESPWAISHMRTGSILVDARIYSIAELRQVWLTHRDEILADHPAAWAVTALRDADET